MQLQAEDPDEGENGEMRWSIVKRTDNGLFTINPTSAILYPAKSLISQEGSYHLEVEVRDGAGKGPNFDIMNVDIIVVSINRNKPEFVMPELPNATVEVPEVCTRF